MYTIVLDDNKEYAIIKELKINETPYTLFASVENPSDICYRKTVIEDDNNEYYERLNDEKEFDLVAMTFAKQLLEENK